MPNNRTRIIHPKIEIEKQMIAELAEIECEQNEKKNYQVFNDTHTHAEENIKLAYI